MDNPAMLLAPTAHVAPFASFFGAYYEKLVDALTQMASEEHGYDCVFKLRTAWSTVVWQHFSAAGLRESDFTTYQHLLFGAGGQFPKQPLSTLSNVADHYCREPHAGKGGRRDPGAPQLAAPRCSDAYLAGAGRLDND